MIRELLHEVFPALIKPVLLKSVLEESLYDARKQVIDHQFAASSHQALADMYSGRIAWIHAKLDDLPKDFT